MPKRIMVFNDSKEALGLIGHILKYEGYVPILEAFGVDEANWVASLRPDLVILDHAVHHAAKCWEIALQLRSKPETLSMPVILCVATTKKITEAKDYLKDKGMFLLNTPYSVNDLLLTIKQALRLSADQQAPAKGA
jgi:CheY-like chemotaxis protein